MLFKGKSPRPATNPKPAPQKRTGKQMWIPSWTVVTNKQGKQDTGLKLPENLRLPKTPMRRGRRSIKIPHVPRKPYG